MALLLPIMAVKAQDASLLPNAVQQFFDNNGKPLSSGSVEFQVPNTTTKKQVWKDAGKTLPWTNPITLNAAGRPPGDLGIYGDGDYTQTVKDRNGNLIWSRPTSPNGGGSGGSTNIGDGNLVGTVIPWSGIIPPAQYVFAYGQELPRADYPELFATWTQNASVLCTGGSATLTGLSNTTNIGVGASVEASCLPSGSYVVSKTVTTLVLNQSAFITTNATATIFFYGNGNGTNTFNVPDLRGKVIAGKNNMGGSESTILTQTYFGTNPNAIGVTGGFQSFTFADNSYLPPYTPSGTITITNGAITTTPVSGTAVFGNGAGGIGVGAGAQATITLTGLQSTQATSTAVFSGVSNGGTSRPFSRVQPTYMLNYVVKVTPDISSSSVSGVASIGGMQGVIACGAGLNCSGNTITVDALPIITVDSHNVVFQQQGPNSNTRTAYDEFKETLKVSQFVQPGDTGIQQAANRALLSGPTSATFTGVISGTTLTANSVVGTIAIGNGVVCASCSAGTTIKSFLTGSGGDGTYEVAISQTVGSTSITTTTIGARKLEFQTGTFVITGPIVLPAGAVGIDLVGQGRLATKLVSASGYTGDIISCGGGTTNITTISKMMFSGNSSSLYGFNCNNAVHLDFHDNYMVGFMNYAFKANDGYNITLSDNEITLNSGGGVWVAGQNINNLNIVQNKIYANGGLGILVGGTNSQNINIDKNTIEVNGYGGIMAYNLVSLNITNNYFERNGSILGGTKVGFPFTTPASPENITVTADILLLAEAGVISKDVTKTINGARIEGNSFAPYGSSNFPTPGLSQDAFIFAAGIKNLSIANNGVFDSANAESHLDHGFLAFYNNNNYTDFGNISFTGNPFNSIGVLGTNPSNLAGLNKTELLDTGDKINPHNYASQNISDYFVISGTTGSMGGSLFSWENYSTWEISNGDRQFGYSLSLTDFPQLKGKWVYFQVNYNVPQSGTTLQLCVILASKTVCESNGISTENAFGLNEFRSKSVGVFVENTDTVLSYGFKKIGSSVDPIKLARPVITDVGYGINRYQIPEKSTGNGEVVRKNFPALVSPNLGTPTSIILNNATGCVLSTCTTGDLPVNRLNNGSGASSSTFWRGDGTWATPSGGGTVTGPVSSTLTALAIWNNTGGTSLANSDLLYSSGAFSRTGGLGIPGTNTNSNASSGQVGEYIEAVVSSSSPVSLTTGTAKTTTSISLTAGDWDISGVGGFVPGATTSATRYLAGISLTNNTIGAEGTSTISTFAAYVSGGFLTTFPTPTVRVSISSTTSVYLIALSDFTVSTMSSFGKISARRVR